MIGTWSGDTGFDPLTISGFLDVCTLFLRPLFFLLIPPSELPEGFVIARNKYLCDC